MLTRIKAEGEQRDFFKVLLSEIVDKEHPLVRLSGMIEWRRLEEKIEDSFSDHMGRPSCESRLMMGLELLKYTFELSDEMTLREWRENPYWQYFTGGKWFEHEQPTDVASMSRWRKRMKEAGCEELLAETLMVGIKMGAIKMNNLRRVNVDSTVQEKNVRFPTDSRLYDRAREKLVKEAEKEGVTLRQTYARVSKRELRRQSGYSKAHQLKRAKRCTKKIKTYLGRVVRDIERKMPAPPEKLKKILDLSHRLLEQERNSKNKIYSLHEPQVECINKGKAHKKYEFGTKAGFVTTSRGNWIVGAKNFSGNPYDGHTLKAALEQTTRIIGKEPEMAICDLGYRGHNYEGPCDIQIVNKFRRRVPRSVLKWWNRRSAIEPVIGHLKSDHRLGRNYLKGSLGDQINPILAAVGYNIRKLLAFLLAFFTLFRFLLLYPKF